MLYFFNWVNGPFAGTMDGDTKKKVVPELMPRALFWFRWGAAWTWLTGVLLLGLVFYSNKSFMVGNREWTPQVGIMIAVVFLAPFLYDALHKSGLGKNPKVFGAVAFGPTAVVQVLLAHFAKLEYRASTIHLAAMFGTIMAFNVWYRIWPAQQKIITAVKEGTAPDAALVALAGARSRHNVYMSVPLVWGMINQHTSEKGFAGDRYGMPGDYAFVWYLLVILVAWHIIWQLYKKAPKVKGF